MKKILLILLLPITLSAQTRVNGLISNGSVSVGNKTAADLSSMFDVHSTSKGSLPFTRMSTAQRNAIASPATNLMCVNTSLGTGGEVERYNGAAWEAYITDVSTNTLTNKTMSGASNTFSSIPISAVTSLQTSLNAKVNLAGDTLTGALKMSANKITFLGYPSATDDAANKKYVDDQVLSAGAGTFVNLAGDTLTGALKMSANKITFLGYPSATDDASNKQYVLDQIATLPPIYVNVVGDTMSGILNMNSNKITSVTNPTSAQDAATKSYVDTQLLQLNPAAAVYAASTANIAGTYTNAVSGVCIADTFQGTATVNPFVIDGATPSVGSRILLKDQSSSFQDGVWTLTTQAVGGVSGAIFTRALDFDSSTDINAGQIIPIVNGTVNAGASWYQTAVNTTCNTSTQTWTQFQKASSAYLLSANNLSDVGTKATAFNNVSPMSTLGDLTYEDVTPSGVRLAGNTSATTKFLAQTGTGSVSAAPAWTQPACSNLSNSAASCSTDATVATNITSGTLPAGRLPNPTSSTLGGIKSALAVSHQFVTSVSTTGDVVQAQPAFSDISGTATTGQIPDLSATYVNRAGSTMTGTLNAGNNLITKLSYPSATDDAANKQYVLDQSGTAIPKFTAVSKTGTYSAVINDYISLTASSNYTITLPDATTAASKGQTITATRTDNAPSNVVSVATTSGQTIGSFGTSVHISTQGESWTWLDDGSNWQVLTHRTETVMSTATTLTLSSTGTALAKGTIVRDNASWRREGQYDVMRVDYAHSTAGTAGTGQYNILIIPSGVAANTTAVPVDTNAVTDLNQNTTLQGSLLEVLGGGVAITSSTRGACFSAILYDSTHFSPFQSGSGLQPWGQGNFSLGVANTAMQCTVKIPIANWEP